MRADLATMLLLAPWVGLALWAVYVGLFASVVISDAGGITVQNFLRRTRIPWGRVADIDLRYQLVISTTEPRRVICYGGPASGRRSARERDSARTPAALRDLDRIREDWEGATQTPPDAAAGVRRGWDLPAIIAALVLVAAAGVALAVV